MRVLRSNLGESILRQVVFTDRNIFVTVVAGVNALALLFTKAFDIEIRLLISLLITIFLLLLITIKIDGQYLVKILPYVCKYFLSKHEARI